VEEHLIMFASFKGMKSSDIPAEVEKMIKSVGLTEKRKAYSNSLSGGQKRKLSVAIAFIGNSRVVFLDGIYYYYYYYYYYCISYMNLTYLN